MKFDTTCWYRIRTSWNQFMPNLNTNYIVCDHGKCKLFRPSLNILVPPPKSDGWEFLLGKGRAFQCLQRMNKIDLKIEYILRQSTTRTPQIVKSCHPGLENMGSVWRTWRGKITFYWKRLLIFSSMIDKYINCWYKYVSIFVNVDWLINQLIIQSINIDE